MKEGCEIQNGNTSRVQHSNEANTQNLRVSKGDQEFRSSVVVHPFGEGLFFGFCLILAASSVSASSASSEKSKYQCNNWR